MALGPQFDDEKRRQRPRMRVYIGGWGTPMLNTTGRGLEDVVPNGEGNLTTTTGGESGVPAS